jgi:hypothetical protein
MEKKSDYEISKCLNGWNWGNVKLSDNTIQFYSQSKEWFVINTNNISNLTSQLKNELGLEFNNEDDEYGNE